LVRNERSSGPASSNGTTPRILRSGFPSTRPPIELASSDRRHPPPTDQGFFAGGAGAAGGFAPAPASAGGFTISLNLSTIAVDVDRFRSEGDAPGGALDHEREAFVAAELVDHADQLLLEFVLRLSDLDLELVARGFLSLLELEPLLLDVLLELLDLLGGQREVLRVELRANVLDLLFLRGELALFLVPELGELACDPLAFVGLLRHTVRIEDADLERGLRPRTGLGGHEGDDENRENALHGTPFAGLASDQKLRPMEKENALVRSSGSFRRGQP
jgi:hypothetical protein